jgi:serine/threonine-protein kinase
MVHTAGARSVWGWGSSFDSAEERSFLARRVALYALAIGGFFGMLYAGGLVLGLVVVPDQFIAMHLSPAKLMNLVVVVVGLGIWRAARRADSSAFTLIAGEALLPLLITSGGAIAAPSVPPAFALSSFPLLLAVLALMFRAAFIPSPPLRTVWVGALACVPTVYSQFVLGSRAQNLPAAVTPTLLLVGSCLWCLALIAGTALVSREIYGLRAAVVKAKQLGQYTIERLVGEGGMGAVYVARHARLRRPTALKLLLPERTGPENIARFEREVQLTSQLSHPNTVAVYDYGRTPDGIFYYAMEYIDGLSLAELVEKFGPQPPGRVLHILMQAADALTEAHAIGLIHRDVKPANILLCERAGSADVVKLLDFGLVKDLRPSTDPGLTQTDTIAGTPLYLAPETITNPSSVDRRVDLYALGAVGYCLLTGAPPFEGKSAVEVCGHHLHTNPAPPSARLGRPLPEGVDAVLLACLAKRPEDRPGSARELQARLRECALHAPWSSDDARPFWASRRAALAQP